MANPRSNQGHETEEHARQTNERVGSERERGGIERQGSSGQQMQRGSRPSGPLARGGSPFQLMRQMSEEMDRMVERFFGDVGFGRRGFGLEPFRATGEMTWSPRIEAYQKDDQFVIRAELPGVSKDDINVNISDDAVTLQGQRRHEQQEEREGYYHSEWSYGSFARTIPLPEGAIVDNADASFRDGVLKITIPSPPSGVRQGRRIEIREEKPEGKR